MDYLAVVPMIPLDKITDNSTIILQYDNQNDLYRLEGIVRSHRHKTSESFVSGFIKIDVFANFNGNDSFNRNWVRVVYEWLGIPPESPRRFPGCMTLHVKHTLDKPQMSLDSFIGGDKDE